MKPSSLRFVVLAGISFLGGCGTAAQATTFTVSNLNDSGPGSLRQALISTNAAPDNDIINFAPLVKGTLTLASESLVISSNVSIVGPGSSALTISGNGSYRIFNITKGTVTLSGLTLAKGYIKGVAGKQGAKGYIDPWTGSNRRPSSPGEPGENVGGGAISNVGVLTLTNVSLLDNTAQGGAGGKGGRGEIVGLAGIIRAGRGGDGGWARGGAIFNTGTLKLNRTLFARNLAQGGQGGNGGTVSQLVTHTSTIVAPGGNGGDAYGGAIFNGGTLQVSNSSRASSTFTGNRALPGQGGLGPKNTKGTAGTADGNDIRDVIPTIQNATFSGLVGNPFQGQLTTTGDSLTYSIVSGTLPPGLALNPHSGLITGTPTTAVTGQRITFQVSDGIRTSTTAIALFTFERVPVLRVNAPAVREGNGGDAIPTQLVFTFALSNSRSQSVAVDVQTTTASTAPATAKWDYTALKKTRLTFAPGETRKTIAIPVVGDTAYEDNEHVALQLSNITNATLQSSTAEGTIVNDDPLPTLSINDVSVTEGNHGYTKATFTVTLLGTSDRTISVGYATSNTERGGAVGNSTPSANVDYFSTFGTLTFSPGQTTKTITVYILGDALVEPNEPFLVRLSSPVNARITDGVGLGTIINDDGASSTQSITAPSSGNS